jgi:two-component system chemotaxis response regulator CheY
MRKKTIMIVDDSTTMRRMITASLRDLQNVGFDEACSGLEAIEHLALSPVDLIILDLNMPDMHGRDVVDFVRRHQLYRGIPTTRGDESSRSALLAAGATVYVTKPFLPHMLAEHVTELLALNN